MKTHFTPLLFLAFLACKKTDSIEGKNCVPYEISNNTASSIDPLSYVNSCDAYSGDLVPGGAVYLRVDANSLPNVQGVMWERLYELPVPEQNLRVTRVPELAVFNGFNPDVATLLNYTKVKYWDTTKVKHEISVSVNGSLPRGVNGTVVINSITEDGARQVFNKSFEDGGRLETAQKISGPPAEVKAYWRFWKFKYQDGQKMIVNGKYVTEPLGEIEHTQVFMAID